jgi:hypothetical protein
MEQEIYMGSWPVDFGDGKERFLKFSIGAIKKVRRQYGTMKDMLATDAVDVVPVLLFAALVDETGAPSREFKTQDAIEAILPFSMLKTIHLQTMNAFFNVDQEKLRAETEAKNALASEADPNSQIQAALQ